ncbi:PREDICTED: uncharacterized protein LOC106813059 [Priapulus caudatus]|uniref:Uncharacterized protein LOC106813059 n=1 Tax=Priapulus caudatus TaxID=37621 RepID=A0ABM1EK68_PRICU|nr:PREDICTED: uncharacterized protein LOC106813059 [Priapulus caudatus]
MGDDRSNLVLPRGGVVAPPCGNVNRAFACDDDDKDDRLVSPTNGTRILIGSPQLGDSGNANGCRKQVRSAIVLRESSKTDARRGDAASAHAASAHAAGRSADASARKPTGDINVVIIRKQERGDRVDDATASGANGVGVSRGALSSAARTNAAARPSCRDNGTHLPAARGSVALSHGSTQERCGSGSSAGRCGGARPSSVSAEAATVVATFVTAPEITLNVGGSTEVTTEFVGGNGPSNTCVTSSQERRERAPVVAGRSRSERGGKPGHGVRAECRVAPERESTASETRRDTAEQAQADGATCRAAVDTRISLYSSTDTLSTTCSNAAPTPDGPRDPVATAATAAEEEGAAGANADTSTANGGGDEAGDTTAAGENSGQVAWQNPYQTQITIENPHALSASTGIVLRPLYSPTELPDILHAHINTDQNGWREGERSTVPCLTQPRYESRRTRTAPRLRCYGADTAFDDMEPKGCCGMAMNQTIGIRWFVVFVGMVGLTCVVIGIILGILGGLKVAGSDFVTISLLLIGVGMVLTTVSGVAWRITSPNTPNCSWLLGFRNHSNGPNNDVFAPRNSQTYGGRGAHPYSAMLYPEFQFRQPPPSYQASMQDYRLRLLWERSTPETTTAPQYSPPPTYRSNAGTMRPMLDIPARSNRNPSLPPSYRSQESMLGLPPYRPRPTISSSQVLPGQPTPPSLPPNANSTRASSNPPEIAVISAETARSSVSTVAQVHSSPSPQMEPQAEVPASSNSSAQPLNMPSPQTHGGVPSPQTHGGVPSAQTHSGVSSPQANVPSVHAQAATPHRQKHKCRRPHAPSIPSISATVSDDILQAVTPRTTPNPHRPVTDARPRATQQAVTLMTISRTRCQPTTTTTTQHPAHAPVAAAPQSDVARCGGATSTHGGQVAGVQSLRRVHASSPRANAHGASAASEHRRHSTGRSVQERQRDVPVASLSDAALQCSVEDVRNGGNQPQRGSVSTGVANPHWSRDQVAEARVAQPTMASSHTNHTSLHANGGLQRVDTLGACGAVTQL